MAHHHGRLHQLVPRRHHHQDEEIEEEDQQNVATVVSVVFKTMPKTFSGDAVWITQSPKTLVAPPPAQITPSSNDEDGEPSSEPKASSAKPTSSGHLTSDAKSTAKATSNAQHSASTLIVVATSSPTLTGTIAAVTGIAASSNSPSPLAEAAASNGMSGGAKAGLSLGILVAIGAVLGAVLFMYHRKKKQMAHQNVDDEKAAMHNAPPPPAPVQTAPSIQTQRTMSTAPRLSLRPVTQFLPTFAEKRKSAGNLLTVATAATPTSHPNDRSSSPEHPSSPWERLGAVNATGAPQNPFKDPVSRSNSPPQDPFGNNAAIETPQATAPGSPATINTPSDSCAKLDDFANPAPAIAAAEGAPVTVAAVPVARKSPAPSNIKPAMIPSSPAWTIDLPASPGPAPTGPPPIAVAGGPTSGPAPAPSPNNVHRVQLDFKPSMQDELELRAGQLVRMLHEYDDGWALCNRMDRSQQGVVPRTCLSKHPVKPRTGPLRQGPPGPRARGPPVGSPMGPGGIPHPRPLTPQSGRNSPLPPSLSPTNGRMSPNMGPPRRRARSNSNAPYPGPPRSMSPGPYGGGPQNMPPPQHGRPRSNSASQVIARRVPGPSPMNPNANVQMPPRKPLPGQAL